METKKILIVDDEIDVINVLTTILENEGYQVYSACTKEEGLKKAKEIIPDIAILDVMMTTKYEGFELANALVMDKDFKNTAILIHSSIDVVHTTKESVREMAVEFRKDPQYTSLQVIFLKDILSGKAGIDYLDEEGKSCWVPVDGFISKPAKSGKILPEINNFISKGGPFHCS